ncbi:MAG: cbb3-type cytochrome c oxidase subunit I, partial [Steroidobacteraceae bacterium]
PMVYSIGFIFLFVLGGISGIMLADPGIDYQVHNSVFLVAHFHNVAVPGVLFGLIAGYHFWFPKAFGFRLNERWGLISAVCWILGFMLAFFPLYALGVMGLARRTVSYAEPAYVAPEMVAFLGAILVIAALAALVVQLWVSIRQREGNRVFVGDPWDGRGLEWSVSAPPPEYNFAVLPVVTDRDAFTLAKERGTAYARRDTYVDIELPTHSAIGPVLGAIGLVLAFGLVWHIWWMVILATVCLLAALIGSGFARDTARIVPAQQVRQEQQRWIDAASAATAVSRADECNASNAGLADQRYAGVAA